MAGASCVCCSGCRVGGGGVMGDLIVGGVLVVLALLTVALVGMNEGWWS